MSFKSLSLLFSAALLASTHYTAPALSHWTHTRAAQPAPEDYYQPTQPIAPTQPAAYTPADDTATTTTAPGGASTSGSGPSAASLAGPSAYVTYQEYSPSESISTVACSDGANGMIAKGHSTLTGLFPNVGAANFISWNSQQCGTCWTLTSQETGQSVSITAIDQCGSIGGYTAHFDIAPEAFAQLGGSGVADGHVIVSYSQC